MHFPDLSCPNTFCRGAHYIAFLRHRGREGIAASRSLFNPGVLVVVDGDQGLDIAEIIECAPIDEHSATLLARTPLPGCSGNSRWPRTDKTLFHGELRQTACAFIHRTCTYDEVDLLFTSIRECELDILLYVRSLTNDMFEHCAVEDMTFLECEIQADFKKIYLYYSKRRPHIRHKELSETLHRHLRCRIWLHEVNRGSHNNSVEGRGEESGAANTLTEGAS
jgi:hypothetical protein